MRNRDAWWRGKRGEWYVATQLVLMAFVFFAPRTLSLLPAWPSPLARAATTIGAALMVAGGLFFTAALLRLGRNLTPLPYPKDQGTFIQSGAYGVVRHPMYSGGIALSYGWALLVHGWLTLLYATLLFAFLSINADREERWLVSRYAQYPDYQHRIPKLIPFTK